MSIRVTNFLATGVILSLFVGIIGCELGMNPDRSTAQEQSSTWRKTDQGWVDLRHWNRPAPAQAERRIEFVHPLVFAAVILLSSSGFLIWASEEFEWGQFFDND